MGHCLHVLCGLWRALVGRDVVVPFFYCAAVMKERAESKFLDEKRLYMNAEDMEYDYEHEITDEELQQLIDKNEADSEEPGGISAKRREKLVREVSERLKDDSLYQSNLDAATKTDKNENGLNETVIEKCFESADPYFSYLVMRRNALRDGYSADEIDDMTTGWAEQYGIDLDVLDEEWVGAEHLKLKQIKRIKDEAEQDAAIEALATENVLKRERQEAKRAASELSGATGQNIEPLSNEWFQSQSKKTNFINLLRWIALIPVSFAAGVLIYCLLMVLNPILTFGWDDAGLFARLAFLGVSSAAAGGISVYTAARIAPHHKKEATTLFCALLLVISGGSIMLALLSRYYPSIITNISADIAAIFVTWSIIKGRLYPEAPAPKSPPEQL